jgi:hypothetical protein
MMARYKRTLSDVAYDNLLPIIITGTVLAIAALVYYSVQEEKEWDAFAATHECKVVAKDEGSWGYGVTSNGKMGSVFMPGKTTFRCNDGVDYTRSN